jgi:hypothetical protein
VTSVAHEGHAVDEIGREGGIAGRYLANEPIREAIERVASHSGPITMIVGAGASMEAELPSWAELIRRMLDEAAPDVVEPEDTSEWLEAVIDEGLLAAAAVVKALTPTDEDFPRRLREALYGGRAATSFTPQALARQIAWFKQRLGSDVTIVTANYDGLLEQALRDRGLRTQSFVRHQREAPGAAAVYHLHGRLAPSYSATGRLVLAEDDYAQVQWPGSWQERFMATAIDETLCVFVGLSLTDPNLIRWLYRYSDVRHPYRHVAVFVRQASPDLRPAVRKGLERSAHERWRRCGVDVVWADFFGESAQFVHEIALHRSTPDASTFSDRARDRLDTIRDAWLPSATADFRDAQETLSAFLSRLLVQVRTIAKSSGIDLADEHLGLGLWIVDHEQGVVSCIATADRRLNDTSAVMPNQLQLSSRWVVVEAVTRGVVVQRDPDLYASRWRFIRGVPLIVENDDGAERSIVGAVTLTSTAPMHASRLASSPRGVLGAIDELLGAVSLLFQ